jgi:hypothetical protein
MQKFKFVGSECVIGDRKLSKLGEEIMLSEQQIKDVIAPKGAALITEKAFESCGFTEQEISIYAYQGQRITAPEVFMAKLRKAWQLVGVPDVPAAKGAK